MMKDESKYLFHRLNADIPTNRQLNNPFYYEPDELTLKAVDELQRHLPAEPEEGKMWGVLVVEYRGEVGFVNAYSGQIGDKMRKRIGDEWCGCPAVFDYLQPDGYFKTHEVEITDINRQIDELSTSDDYRRLKDDFSKLKKEADDEIARRRMVMNEAKAKRRKRREEGHLTDAEAKEMEHESQFLKAELHRAKVDYREKLNAADEKVKLFEQRIELLKRSRSLKSDHLQAWLFNQFVLLNARGERKPMPDIFRDYAAGSSGYSCVCPSGAGECCEPKMLQYAYEHDMRPLRMASFWWGPALGGELRQHGHFYPACSGRCKPILSWMLQGLDVAPNPLEEKVHQELKIIYEDEFLAVVNKPSGMLAAPGKSDRESVVSILAEKWDGVGSALSVHRLDMATSGLLIVAKDKTTQSLLRKEFENREVEKEYLAIVEGVIPKKSGRISLPLVANPMDRPRQKVDFELGKESITEYEVMSEANGESRLRLKPLTGRTHQLRVHCASPLGLNAPIKGDTLYGTPSGRLYLQARKLSFTHPANGRRMTFTLPPDF